MGLINNLIRSIKKSENLRNLQKKIAPPNYNIDDITNEMLTGNTVKQEAIEEFLELCVEDNNVKFIMNKYNIDKSHLREIYQRLEMFGCGQWVKGHYTSLSTLAYPEPLTYYLEAKKMNISDLEISNTLLDYWEDKIAQGGLYKKVVV